MARHQRHSLAGLAGRHGIEIDPPAIESEARVLRAGGARRRRPATTGRSPPRSRPVSCSGSGPRNRWPKRSPNGSAMQRRSCTTACSASCSRSGNSRRPIRRSPHWPRCCSAAIADDEARWCCRPTRPATRRCSTASTRSRSTRTSTASRAAQSVCHIQKGGQFTLGTGFVVAGDDLHPAFRGRRRRHHQRARHRTAGTRLDPRRARSRRASTPTISPASIGSGRSGGVTARSSTSRSSCRKRSIRSRSSSRSP